MQRRIRVLVGKPGLDGHDRGAKVVAAALRDAGMEVVYTGLHQTPEQIVEAAVQEDVDVVALSVLSGAHMTLFPEIQRLMQAQGIGDKLLTGGGIIPGDDMKTLFERGVGRLFGPGSSTVDIVLYIRQWYGEKFGADALPPLPPPPPRPEPVVGSGDRLTPSPARKPTKRAAAKPVARKPAKPKPRVKPKPKPKVRPKAKRAVRPAARKPRAKPRAKKAATKPTKKATPKKAARRR